MKLGPKCECLSLHFLQPVPRHYIYQMNVESKQEHILVLLFTLLPFVVIEQALIAL